MEGMKAECHRRMSKDSWKSAGVKHPYNPGSQMTGTHARSMKKIGKMMREFKGGKLRSGSRKGPVVKSRRQAIAISLNAAKKAGAQISRRSPHGRY